MTGTFCRILFAEEEERRAQLVLRETIFIRIIMTEWLMDSNEPLQQIPDLTFYLTVFLGAFSTTITHLVSPIVIAICRRKSNRLMAILGGLMAALGCLFTSFATQFHQLFFSFGLFIGIGNAMIRDPAVIMIGQYFKKKRALVEILVIASQGLGIAFTPLFLTYCIRLVSLPNPSPLYFHVKTLWFQEPLSYSYSWHASSSFLPTLIRFTSWITVTILVLLPAKEAESTQFHNNNTQID